MLISVIEWNYFIKEKIYRIPDLRKFSDFRNDPTQEMISPRFWVIFKISKTFSSFVHNFWENILNDQIFSNWVWAQQLKSILFKDLKQYLIKNKSNVEPSFLLFNVLHYWKIFRFLLILSKSNGQLFHFKPPVLTHWGLGNRNLIINLDKSINFGFYFY